ncbi:MAG: YitT family protein [Clostridiales bacterium]|nr:YitT family protein [Clostridiales bacterium]
MKSFIFVNNKNIGDFFMEILKNNKFKLYIVDLIYIIIGTFIMACSVDFFLLPNQLSTGGFSGIGTIAYYFFNMPVGFTMLLLNVPLFVFAFFKMGKGFFLKSIIGTILFSIFLDFLENDFLIIQDRFLACIYGGILSGVGTAFVLKGNGSTGGSDLISYIICLYNKKFKAGDIIIIFDIIMICINILFFREIQIGLYSAIAIYLMGKMIDIFFEGINFTKILFIISDKNEEIAKAIGDIVQRGSTGLYAKGMHYQEEKIMLFCIGTRNQIINIKKIVTDIDATAFIVITNARETFGKGFKKYIN